MRAKREPTSADLLAQIGRIERAYEESKSEVGWKDSRIAELESEAAAREIELTGLETELRAAQGGL